MATSSFNNATPTPAQAGLQNFNFQSRDEVKKLKELDEARKAGLIPAEKDEEGKDINPHIPQYMIKAPWYLKADQSVPSLKHQRHHDEVGIGVNDWYRKWVGTERPEKFRKGACENCGASTHTKHDCTERPRQRGAKWTNADLQPDEFTEIPAESLSFDAKRDRWGGYDPSEYKEVVRVYEQADMERRRRKTREIQKQLSKVNENRKKKKLQKRLEKLGDGPVQTKDDTSAKDPEAEKTEKAEKAEGEDDQDSSDSDSDSESDTDSNDSDDDADARIRDFDAQNAPVGTKDDRTRTTTRNLRIREDTAKYLYNLDVNSAFYDPKTRSTRDNPLKHIKESEQAVYRGDNALRNTGDAAAVPRMEAFAWDLYKHGTSAHFQSMPTQLEKMYQQHKDGKARLEESRKDRLLNRYGGREHLQSDPLLLIGQTEVYQEYERDGTIKKGGVRLLIQSKYEEDQYPSNHTSVWGSWYDRSTGIWGFSCCHSNDRSSSCSAQMNA